MYKVEQYYIIKVIDTKYNWTAYKLGQERFGRNRAEALVKKYQSLSNIKAEILHKEILPHITTRYITDTRVREELVTRKFFDSVDQFAVKGHLEETDGITEFLYNTHNYNDDTIISTVQTAVKALSLKKKNFTGKLKKIDNFELHYNPAKKHLVCYDLIKIIERFCGSCISKCRDKSILLIGQFEPDWVASFAMGNNVFIMHDSNEQKHEYKCDIINKKLTYISNFEELINLDMEFDIIIANPPYEMGNQITKNILENVTFGTYVNLMPLSRYKKDELYKKIKDITILAIGEAGFDDAATAPHICELKSDYNNQLTYKDIQLFTYNQKWIKYYKENLKREASWECFYRVEASHPIKNTFLLTVRTGVDGVHKTKNCLDYTWNIENICDYSKFPKSTGAQAIFSTFKTNAERENIISWWYQSKIASDLVCGLNRQSLSESYAFLPKVDWTRPWTDEQILKDYGYSDEEITEILK